MSYLEHLISRYLDGELTPGELRELQRRLDRSPEARALLREMTAVTRSARDIPSLDMPARELEARLFHRLHAEGLGQNARPVAMSTQSTAAARARSFGRPTAALLLLVLFALTTSYWLSDGTIPRPPVVAEGANPAAPPSPSQTVPDPRSTDIAQAPIATRAPLSSVQAPPWRGRVIERRASTGSRSRNTESRTSPERVGVQPERIDGNAAHPIDQNPPKELNPAPLTPNENPIAQVSPDYSMPNDPLQNLPPVEMPEPPTPGRQSMLAASFRPTGFSFVDGRNSAPELSLRIDARVGRNDQISFIVGRSPLRAEQNETAIIASSPALASNDNGSVPRNANLTNTKSNAAMQEPSTSVELENETWGGIGYSHTFARLGPAEVSAGARAGVGAKSTRFGLEGSVRYSISNVVAIECVPTVTHVIPHDQSRTTMMLEDRSTGTLSFGESKHSTFTAVGVEFGVRIAIR